MYVILELILNVVQSSNKWCSNSPVRKIFFCILGVIVDFRSLHSSSACHSFGLELMLTIPFQIPGLAAIHSILIEYCTVEVFACESLGAQKVNSSVRSPTHLLPSLNTPPTHFNRAIARHAHRLKCPLQVYVSCIGRCLAEAA